MSKGISFNLIFPAEIPIQVEVLNYHPGRPAPACSNPDNPKFSDPGDSPEIEFGEIYFRIKEKKIKIEDVDLFEYITDAYMEYIEQEGNEIIKAKQNEN